MCKQFLFFVVLVLFLSSSAQRSVVSVINKRFFSNIDNSIDYVLSGNVKDNSCGSGQVFDFESCSGVLVKDNKVLVQGECLKSLRTNCRDYFFTFDFDHRKKRAVSNSRGLYVYPVSFKLGQSVFECLDDSSHVKSRGLFKLKQVVKDRRAFSVHAVQKPQVKDLLLVNSTGEIHQLTSLKSSRSIASIQMDKEVEVESGILIDKKLNHVVSGFSKMQSERCVNKAQVQLNPLKK